MKAPKVKRPIVTVPDPWTGSRMPTQASKRTPPGYPLGFLPDITGQLYSGQARARGFFTDIPTGPKITRRGRFTWLP